MNILIDGQVLDTDEVRRGIGIYFINVIKNMVKQTYGNNWYITVPNEDVLKALDLWTANRLIPIINENFHSGADYERESKFTKSINNIIKQYAIDFIWIPDPLMVNVLFPNDTIICPVYATIFDLIPAIMPPPEWSESIKKEYKRRLRWLKDNDVRMLCISKATDNDLRKMLGDNINTSVTFLAADDKLFYTKTKRQDENPIIVFTGGFDYRKNLVGAVKAYEKAFLTTTDTNFLNSNFYIVCKASEAQKNELLRQVSPAVREHIVLTGFISDKELANLYAMATVFFYPSLYEGFGLPILESMLGGAYVLSADNSSLPEVCSGHAVLCNASDIEDMASKLLYAFNIASKENLEARVERQNYALKYSWSKTAEKTFAYFKTSSNEFSITNKKIKIALVTPWPPMETGVANFEYMLLPYLSKYFSIDIFADDTLVKTEALLTNSAGSLFKLSDLDAKHNLYDAIIYEIGNNKEFHAEIYRYLLKYPGVAEIHDYNLGAFFWHSYYLGGGGDIYKQALVNGYGNDGRNEWQRIMSLNAGPNTERFPMSQAVDAVSKYTIVHNSWSYLQLNSKHSCTIPHPCFPMPETDNKNQIKFRERFCINKGDLIIGCFGFINPNKHYHITLQAFKRIAKTQKKVHFIFWGEAASADVQHQIEKMQLQDKVHISGYLPKEQYNSAIAMTDVVVNLRYPSMGESSGTLCEAFAAAKPVIVSAVNQYMEFPDEVCWKLPVYEDIPEKEIDLLARYLTVLIQNGEVRKQLGRNAYEYATTVLSGEQSAKLYYEVVYKLIKCEALLEQRGLTRDVFEQKDNLSSS